MGKKTQYALVSSYAIFHVPRDLHASIYRSFHRVLKPNGKFLISIGFSDWGGIEDFYETQMYWIQNAKKIREPYSRKSDIENYSHSR